MSNRLSAGDKAPNFELRDADGNTYSLSGLEGQKVVLYFYPADDTPGCTAQACELRDTHDVWEKSGYTILGVSSQGAESKKAFREKYDLNFPLLIDEDFSAVQAYGVDSRSTFVIDEEGRIEHALYDVNPRGHSDMLREKLGV